MRRNDRVEIYQARDGWRWRRVSPNGRIIGESGEAYKQKKRCTDMAVRSNKGPAEIRFDGVLQEYVV